MAKQTFTTGQVLTAAQVNSLQSNDFNQTVSVKTAAYTLVAADKGTRIEFNTSGSVAVTVNTGLFDAGDTLVIQNRGAGVVTVTAGTATVNTSATLALSQYDAGTLYFISASAAIFFNTDAGGGSPLTTKGDLYGFSSVDARIPIGANNTVLTADSTEALGLKWAASAGALTFITGTTFSAVSSFSLPANTFTATYDNYLVRLQLTDASAASAVTCRLRAGGTDTTTLYYSAQTRLDYLLSGSSLGENATTSWGLGSINTGGTNQQIFQYDLNFKQPFNTKHTLVNSAGSIGNIVSSVGLLAKVDLTSYDSLTFACSSGTITGNYRVYGYANS